MATQKTQRVYGTITKKHDKKLRILAAAWGVTRDAAAAIFIRDGLRRKAKPTQDP